MGTRDPRVDAYIEKSAEFARPILSRLREIVHEACPRRRGGDQVERAGVRLQGPLANMAAFKAHCAFALWKGSLVVENPSDEAMGQLGRIESLSDLPPEAKVPADLKQALAGSAKARATFEGFSPSHRREYVEWIEEAKRPGTRARRIATAVEWLAEGKSRNWKYE